MAFFSLFLLRPFWRRGLSEIIFFLLMLFLIFFSKESLPTSTIHHHPRLSLIPFFIFVLFLLRIKSHYRDVSKSADIFLSFFFSSPFFLMKSGSDSDSYGWLSVSFVVDKNSIRFFYLQKSVKNGIFASFIRLNRNSMNELVRVVSPPKIHTFENKSIQSTYKPFKIKFSRHRFWLFWKLETSIADIAHTHTRTIYRTHFWCFWQKQKEEETEKVKRIEKSHAEQKTHTYDIRTICLLFYFYRYSLCLFFFILFLSLF